MLLNRVSKFGDKLPTRIARGNGIGAVIAIPKECSGTRYERYIDRKTGIITLIPCEKNITFPGDVDEGGGNA